VPIAAGLARVAVTIARHSEATGFILDIRAWFIQFEKVIKAKSLLTLAGHRACKVIG
jgi:hypothetical protein